MHIITAGSAPRFELPGVEFTGYAAPSRGSDALCTWQITVAAGLVSDQAHTLDQDEIFQVTSGTIRLKPDGPVVAAGDCAIVPAGEPILLSNPREATATAIVAIRSGFTAKMADGSAVNAPPWAQ